MKTRLFFIVRFLCPVICYLLYCHEYIFVTPVASMSYIQITYKVLYSVVWRENGCLKEVFMLLCRCMAIYLRQAVWVRFIFPGFFTTALMLRTARFLVFWSESKGRRPPHYEKAYSCLIHPPPCTYNTWSTKSLVLKGYYSTMRIMQERAIQIAGV